MTQAAAAHEPQRLIITAAQYEAIVAPPPVIPTQGEIFESQIALYAEYGLGTESEFRRLAEFIPETGLFLLVPKKPDPIDLQKLMSMVELNGKRGTNYLDPAYLKDLVTVPKSHYLALGIEDGRSRLDVAPRDSRKNIERENRSGYVTLEGICHAAVFPVLSHHNMDCVGSQCVEKFVPLVYVDDDKPALNDDWDDGRDPEWGAPSCRERKGF